uniref:C-type lectin domain-containing protein n=1 Tax=Sander lucioperca TaxID=283035 RepID=A0A8C9X9W9_SANLU
MESGGFSERNLTDVFYILKKGSFLFCFRYWTKFLCQHILVNKKTWKEAQEYCRKNHTDLATVSNQTDMQRLLESTTEQYQGGAWIGLQDKTTNTVCRWRWSQSGVEFNVTESKWSQGQPDNLGNQENCVRMNDGTWQDDSCSTKYNFICYEGENMWCIESCKRRVWWEIF